MRRTVVTTQGGGKGLTTTAAGVVGLAGLLCALLFPAAAVQSAQEIKLMPLGDSITEGCCQGDNGYRKPLYEKLSENGYSVSFVGSMPPPDSETPDELTGYCKPNPEKPEVCHEGHSSFTATNLLECLKGDSEVVVNEGTKYPSRCAKGNKLETYQPDIVLVHVGTNDMDARNFKGVGQAVKDIRKMVSYIYEQRPSATVFLAKITLTGYCNPNSETCPAPGTTDELFRDKTRNDRTRDFNKGLETLARKLRDDGHAIALVDMETALNYEEYSPDIWEDDGVHLREPGFDKMAEVWFRAISGFLARGAGGFPLAAMNTGADNAPRVYYFDVLRQVQELAWSQGKWYRRNTSAAAGAPIGAGSSALAAMGVHEERWPRTYFADEAGRVQELAWSESTQRWNVSDLGAGIRVAAAAPDSPLAVMGTGAARWPRVYYLSQDQDQDHSQVHVHELAWSEEDRRWNPPSNLMTLSGGPPAAAGSSLATIATRAERWPRVYYLSQDQDQDHSQIHVHELAWSETTHQWNHSNLTLISGAPSAVAGSPLAAMGSGAERWPRVYYLSQDQDQDHSQVHVHELAWSERTHQWNHSNLTPISEAPSAVAGSPLAAIGSGAERWPRVYYLDQDRQVHELAWSEDKLRWNVTELDGTIGAPAVTEGSALAAVGAGEEHFPRVYYVDRDRQVNELAWSEKKLQWERRNLTNESVPFQTNSNQLVYFREIIPPNPWTPDGCPDGFYGGKYRFIGRLTNRSKVQGQFVPDGIGLTNVLVHIQELSGGNMLKTGERVLLPGGRSFAIPAVGLYQDGILSPGEKVDVPFSVCLRKKNPFRLFVNVMAVQK